MINLIGLLLIFVTWLITLSGVWAQSPTTSPTRRATPTPSPQNQRQIDELKERLATKVAELRQTQKRAIFGPVKAISVSTLTIETATRDVKLELSDDVLVYQTIRQRRTKLALDDVDIGDAVVVFGDHDATLDLLTPKLIFIQTTAPQRIGGTVNEIDSEENIIIVKTGQDLSVTIDIERATLTNLWSKDQGITKGGFSKISVGDTVHVQGTPVPKKENRLTAIRILDLGNLTGAPTEAPSPSPSPKP